MQKYIISLAIVIFSGFQVWSQTNKFTTAMQSALVQLDTAKNAAQFTAAGNTFARIAAAETKEWLPDYYAAYAQLIAGFITSSTDMDKGQLLMDQAQASLQAAQKKATQPADLSEIAVLQAYIYIGKITEDPMAKGGTLSPQVFAELGKAAAMNPANPRAPMIQGMFTLNMPEFYGGGAKNAKPLFEKAQLLFDAEKNQDIRPDWGAKQNAEFLAKASNP